MSILDTIRNYISGRPATEEPTQSMQRTLMPPSPSFRSRLPGIADNSTLGIVKNTITGLPNALLTAPKYSFADRYSWKTPVRKLGSELLQGTMNTFHNVRDYATEATDQYYGNKPADFGALAGKGLNAAIGLAGLTAGGGAVQNAAKNAMNMVAPSAMKGLGRQIAKEAWKGSSLSGQFGAAQGLADSLQNHANIGETMKNVGTGYFGGRAAGFGLGFGASAVPALTKAAAGSASKAMYRTSGKYPYFSRTLGQAIRAVPESMKMAPRVGFGIEDVSEKQIGNYLKKAYKVYSGQSPAHVVARLADDISQKTNLPKDIVVKRAFFEKMAESHPEIDRQKLFSFVRTLNIPDSVYKLPEAERLNFFRNVSNDAVNIVSTGKDMTLPQSNVVTSFNVKPTNESRRRYIENIKNTSFEVFPNSGGRRQAPSSDNLSEVPGTGATKFPGLQSSSDTIIPNIQGKVNTPRPRTVSDLYDAYIATEKAAANDPVKASGDLLEKTPLGKRARMGAEDVTVFNYQNELRAIGAARTKKELDKIGYRDGLKIIEDWKAKHVPGYWERRAEKESFKNFVSDFQASEEKGITRGLGYVKKYSDIPADKAEQIISFLDTPAKAPEDIAPFVDNLRKEFNDFHAEAKEAGLDVKFWNDYVTHIWAESPQTVAKRIESGLRRGVITPDDLAVPGSTNTPYFGPANSRGLKTYEAGERIGLHKKYSNPAQIVAHYAKNLEQAKSIARNIALLKEKGLVVPGPQQGMAALTAPGMEGLSASPDLAKKMNNAFGRYEYTGMGKVLEKAARLSRNLKEMLMSGGVPASTINSYGIGMTLKEIGTLSPTRAKNALSSFIIANSPGKSRQFFIDNIKQIKKIKRNDIAISTMLDDGGFVGKSFMKDWLGEGRIFSADANHWAKIMNEPTFKRYLPMNQIKFFNSIESRLRKNGYSAKEAEKIAAKELREGMGIGSAAKEAGKSQVWKDWRETLFFAPTHRMNMIRVFGNAAKALGRNPFTPGNQSAAQFLLGGAAVYAMYDWVNYKNTGKHLWENPTGKKFEAYIKVGDQGNLISIPFMPTVATMPRLGIDVTERVAGGDLGGAFGRAWQGTGSILGKPLADVVMNEDYFGRSIANEKDDPSKQYWDKAKYLGKSYTGHPWIKAGIDFAGGKPAGQVMVQAAEAPIRFTTQDDLSKKVFWDEYFKAKPLSDRYSSLLKTDEAAAANFYEKNRGKIDSYRSDLLPMYNQYRALKKAGAQGDFGKLLQGGAPDGVRESNGFVLYKGADGLTKSIPREQYDRQLLAARMTAADRGGDTQGWLALAQERFNAIEKTLATNEIDPLDRVKLENERAALVKKATTKLKKKRGGASAGKVKKPPVMRARRLPNLRTSIRSGRAQAKKLTLRDLFSKKAPSIV